MTDPASVGADERLRLFLALRLPEPVLDAIETWQQEHLQGVGPGLRVVRRDELHITVAFLGLTGPLGHDTAYISYRYRKDRDHFFQSLALLLQALV